MLFHKTSEIEMKITLSEGWILLLNLFVFCIVMEFSFGTLIIALWITIRETLFLYKPYLSMMYIITQQILATG